MRATNSLETGSTVDKDVEYELSYLRKRRFSLVFGGVIKMVLELFLNLARGGSASKSELSFLNSKDSLNAPSEVIVKPEQFVLARKSDLGLVSEQYIADSQMEAFEMYRQMKIDDPVQASEVQVVTAYELNTEAA